MSGDSEGDFDGGPFEPRAWQDDLDAAISERDLPATGWLEVTRVADGERAFVRMADDGGIVAAISLIDLAEDDEAEAWGTSRVQWCIDPGS